MPKEENVSNAAQVINADVDDHVGTSAPIVRGATEVGISASAADLMHRMGIRTIAERVAAVARLSGQTRVLLTGCRSGDGASTVAGALALDLSLRLSIETLLVDADRRAGFEPSKAGGNGAGQVRVNATPVPKLFTARYARIDDYAPVSMGTAPAGPNDALEELRQVMAGYRATVVDVGVVRLDARMLAVAAPDDPVLVVARYGCTRREELTATLAILNLAKCRIGGVILNGYESPATDWLLRISGLGKDRQ